MMFTPALGIALIALLILIRVLRNLSTKRQDAAAAAHHNCAHPPTLPRKGFLGLGRLSELSQANKQGRTPQWFVERFNELGDDVHTFRASALDFELVVTRDPENARAVFAANARDFEISPYRKAIWSPLLGDGIFTAQGENWKHSRQLLRPQFSRDHISDLELEEKHIQSLFNVDALKTGVKGWTDSVDLGPLLLNFTLDVATEFLYGQSVESQSVRPAGASSAEGDGKLDSGFSYHLDAGKSCLYRKGLFGRWSFLCYSPSLARHCREVHKFVDELVVKRLSRPSIKPATDPDRFFLLDQLAKSSQNPLELRNETLQILNAGRDTTGALLGWAFYFLARNSRVFTKLRETILADFGHDEIAYPKLKSCEYLHQTIQEVLRVAAVVPVNERVCIRATTLPRGGGPDGTRPVFLRKGQRVLIANYAMQHRPDLWGVDVDEFKPERWAERRVGFDFLPFGAGPRKCIGQQFALTETAYTLVRFLQRFDKIENMEAPGPPFFHCVFSNRSGTGVQVRLHEAVV
ncbi:hypothetical protein BP6252_13102 [Coleophoma cylindrospora]|uniref:Uncharacterized protein n=1 Tax=Coleophoma cylindrospora TaxID=1849047 RepID=A0A3D8Q9X4_9HELO|nr:hypothetical protein BP6252_13102 [Coleophoma cylindrospora]